MCARGNIVTRLINRRNVGQILVKNYTSAVHTLKVAEQIQKRREAALLGGGQKRIDAQHKKVGGSDIYMGRNYRSITDKKQPISYIIVEAIELLVTIKIEKKTVLSIEDFR